MLQRALSVSSLAPVVPKAADAGQALADIEAEGARLHLVLAGRSFHWPGNYMYPPRGADAAISFDSWLWEVFGARGRSLGFLGLVPVRPVGGENGIFGPVLAVMLKRDLAQNLGSEIIAALMQRLAHRNVCHIVHASHMEADSQLAAWLDSAGFLYTGRHEGGARSMILIL